MGFLDQDRFNSTPKQLPLYSFPTNRFCETPGLATPPVNIAGSVPFSWEEAPGKPLRKPSKSKQNNLELPPRLLLSKEAYKSAINEPSPTTVLDGPYGLHRRSLSLPRPSSGLIRKVKEKSLLFGSNRWRNLGKCKEISEGRFDFLLPRDGFDGDSGGCDWNGGGEFSGDGGGKMKIDWGIKRKGSIFDISRAKSDFWGRVYEGFKQVIVIPWKRRKQQNLGRG